MARKQQSVSEWLAAFDHPLRSEIDEVRAIIAGADVGVSELIKWNAPTFSAAGHYLVTFHVRPVDRVHLVFHHLAAPEVESPLLDGDYADGRRMMYFSDRAAIDAGRDELVRVIRELIARTS